MADAEGLTYEQIEAAANFVVEKIPDKPRIGIICGKGIDTLADTLADKIDIPYTDIPNFPECSVPGHPSILTYGTLEEIPIICFRGRFHFYEGHTIDHVVLPVRLLKLMGAQMVVITNASGGINATYAIGDVVLLKDHINFVGLSDNKPVKPPDERFGQKNSTMKYDKDLRDKAKEAFKNAGFGGTVHEGIYACSAASRFQTPAETSLLKNLGCDFIGTSITHEALAASQCGLSVLALGVIHRLYKSDYDEESKEENVNGASLLQPFLQEYLKIVGPDLKPPAPEEPPAEEAPPTEEPAGEAAPAEESEGEKPPEEEAAPPEEEKPPEAEKPPAEVTDATPSKIKRPCECKDKKKDNVQGKPSEASEPPPAPVEETPEEEPPKEEPPEEEPPKEEAAKEEPPKEEAPKEDEPKKKKKSCECKTNPLKQSDEKKE